MAIAVTDLGSAQGGTTVSLSISPVSNGLLVVCLSGKDNSAAQTVATLDTVNMTSVLSQVNDTNLVGVYYASVTAGNHTVALSSFGGAVVGTVITAFLLTGVSGTAPTATVDHDNASGTSNAADLTVADGGVAIYSHLRNNSGNSTSWSAATNADDRDIPNFTARSSAGYYLSGSSGTHTETVSWTGSTFGRVRGAAWSASVSATLTSNTGTFTLTGVTTALNKGKLLLATAGSYALTGITNLFHVTLSIKTVVGAYTFTGQNSALRRIYKIVADVGAFLYRGAWHSPNPDWDVHRRKNRWWRRLLNG